MGANVRGELYQPAIRGTQRGGSERSAPVHLQYQYSERQWGILYLSVKNQFTADGSLTRRSSYSGSWSLCSNPIVDRINQVKVPVTFLCECLTDNRPAIPDS